MVAVRARSGPLPTPEDFAAYEETCPGAADRLLSMVEETHASNIKVRDQIVRADITDRARGMNYGFVSLVLILVLAFGLALLGKDGLAAALFSAGALGVIATFVQGRR